METQEWLTLANAIGTGVVIVLLIWYIAVSKGITDKHIRYLEATSADRFLAQLKGLKELAEEREAELSEAVADRERQISGLRADGLDYQEEVGALKRDLSQLRTQLEEAKRIGDASEGVGDHLAHLLAEQLSAEWRKALAVETDSPHVLSRTFFTVLTGCARDRRTTDKGDVEGPAGGNSGGDN